MIGRLHGRVVTSEPDGSLIVDVNGVGYELVSPIGTLGRVKPDGDGKIALMVHTHLREGALELFGFATEAEREAFRTLIGISKVGPKMAMAVLSFSTVNELAHIVATGDAARLTKVPGVGKKTAERMVLELEGKLAPAIAVPASAAAPAGDHASVLTAALVRMGFKQGEAERAVSGMSDLDRPLSDLVREALAVLAP